jgi:predicted transcriptional regulator of viral defense system
MSENRGPAERARRLYEIASNQGGFFTATQARGLGYSNSKQHYHVRAGNWIRESRGICRLALYPEPERPDLILWWLWSRDKSGLPKGVYGHQTALSLFELTDLNPSKLEMIVPKGFRRGVPLPSILRLHRNDVSEDDVTTVHDVPATRPLRSLLDVVRTGDVPLAVLQEGYREAMRRGMVTPSELDRARQHPETAHTLQQLRRRKAA